MATESPSGRTAIAQFASNRAPAGRPVYIIRAVSPLTLRRYRAERLLRQQFQALHTGVIRAVGRRLRSQGVSLDEVDLQACYATAWHGLYAAVLADEQIDNPAGWLAVVTYRRAIDEHRARMRIDLGLARDLGEDDDSERGADAALARGARHDGDLAAELDDRARLRELFEGLRSRLSSRELQAATLCYLHGLSRAQAAQRLGVSETGMRKLMEGRGPGRPGVAAKVRELVATIGEGGWCHEQGSLMRGLALGILDPAGERYRLARAHRDECPSCRAYVRALRGLAVVLPPAPALLRSVLAGTGASGAGAAGGAGAQGVASLHAGLAGRAGGAASGTGAAPPAAAAAGAGGGAAGGGWLVAGGGAATKVVLGCLVAAGLGAGCVALSLAPSAPSHAADHHRGTRQGAHAVLATRDAPRVLADHAEAAPRIPAVASTRRSAAVSPQARASREFGPEQPGQGSRAPSGATAADRALAADADRAAGISSPAQAPRAETLERSATGTPRAPSSTLTPAQREFGIG